MHDGGHTEAEKDETEADDEEPVSRKEAAASLMVQIQSVTCAAENAFCRENRRRKMRLLCSWSLMK